MMFKPILIPQWPLDSIDCDCHFSDSFLGTWFSESCSCYTHLELILSAPHLLFLYAWFTTSGTCSSLVNSGRLEQNMQPQLRITFPHHVKNPDPVVTNWE
jgi:hypothetical protein